MIGKAKPLTTKGTKEYFVESPWAPESRVIADIARDRKGKGKTYRGSTRMNADQEIGDRKGKTFNHKGHPFDSLTLAQGRLWDTKDGGKSR